MIREVKRKLNIIRNLTVTSSSSFTKKRIFFTVVTVVV